MRQIAYFSTAAEPQTAELVHGILVTARIFNRRHAVSGMLVAGGNRYLQVIEGEDELLKRLYSAIRRDRRHLAITTLLDRAIMDRSFADWSMAFRREPALGQFDSFPHTLRYLTEQVSDPALRRQIELFARTFIAVPGDRSATPWDKVA
jgi:hypothetical protein